MLESVQIIKSHVFGSFVLIAKTLVITGIIEFV